MSHAGYRTRKDREQQFVLQHALSAIKRLRKIVSMTPKSHPTLASIDAVVSLEFGLEVADLKGPSLWCIDVAARQVAMSLAYILTPHSLVEIAAHFHRGCHTVVIHAHRKYGDDLIELCKANELPVYIRVKGFRTTISAQGIASGLKSLARWKAAPTTADDIFPDLSQNVRSGLLHVLRKRGYVSRERDDRLSVSWWQITPAGLDALQQLKAA